ALLDQHERVDDSRDEASAARIASGRLVAKAPSSTRNSPTKLPRPGSPRDATAKNSANAPIRGSAAHSPPSRRHSRAGRRPGKAGHQEHRDVPGRLGAE